MTWKYTKQTGVGVTPTYIQEMLGLNLSGTLATWLRIAWFLQYPQANAGIVPHLGYTCFLLNPFQFIIHQSPYHSMLSVRNTIIIIIIIIIKQTTKENDIKVLMKQRKKHMILECKFCNLCCSLKTHNHILVMKNLKYVKYQCSTHV
jgi:hypothetical protein